MQIPKTPETHDLRTRLHRAYSLAGLAAWEGDLEAAEKHAEMARLLAHETPRPRPILVADSPQPRKE